MPAAATAGIVMAVALLLPLAVFFLWMLVGGALAVAFYHRGNPQPISPREGARIGAVSGLLGFVLFAVGYSIVLLVGGGGGELRQELMRRMQEVAARSSDPQAQQMVQKLMTPEALVFMIAIALLLFLIIFVVLGSLGGAAGAALFRERDSK